MLQQPDARLRGAIDEMATLESSICRTASELAGEVAAHPEARPELIASKDECWPRSVANRRASSTPSTGMSTRGVAPYATGAPVTSRPA
jgi:hypothetical protein